MFFFDWQIALLLSVAVLLVIAGALGLKSAGVYTRQYSRSALRFTGIGLALLGSLSLLLIWASSECTSHSAPIYSPSRMMAARVERLNGGATEGSDWVELYWAHGFRKTAVFSAQGAWAEPADIHWESDSKLTIHYQGLLDGDGFPTSSAHGVTVECSPRPLQ